MDRLVSIITPAYNAEKYIGESIESVLNQDYKHWEMIIVNDCSKDNTKEIIEKYIEKDSRIKLISLEKNGGVANARNTAIKNASGKYLAFLDSDDLWKPNKISKHIEFMKENQHYFTFSNYEIIDNEGNTLNKEIKAPKIVDYERLLKGNPIGCLTTVIDKERIGKVIMPAIGHEDYATWLNILKKDIIAYNVGDSLAYYRKADNSLSSNKMKAIKWTWNIYRNNQGLGLLKSVQSMVGYVINTVIKNI